MAAGNRDCSILDTELVLTLGAEEMPGAERKAGAEKTASAQQINVGGRENRESL